MHRYLVWKTGPGALSIECRRLGEAALRPNIQIVTPTGALSLAREDEMDLARFHLDDRQVASLLASPGTMQPPCLVFDCAAFLARAAPARTWGWSIRMIRGCSPLAGEHLGGRPLALRRDGFTRAVVRHLPDQARVAHDHVIIGLA
ncbi:hypothetical protein OVA07_02935 [Novosphingobium sp. SL115]|uniref:hypothetical protein n=1 Tax=Novosphingobium sp. SL115 TaxID=2995150 RepID=UPI0022731F77|nr:hypothetical protein [Novosphingobium sp. SL115]MCY1669963.1 hypothetical protein [Novosphingobium sp. SL115]